MARPKGRFLVALCALSLSFSRLVTVVGCTGRPCATVRVGDTGGSVASLFDYQSFQEALEFAASQDPRNCTVIELLAGEEYSIVRSVAIASGLSVRTVGSTGRAAVTIVAAAERARTQHDPYPYDPLFVLNVTHTDHVLLEGLDFFGSSGIINIQDVTSVQVSNCSFSYFSEGVMDIYDCPLVMVTDCLFKDNGPVAFTLKRERFHGHSGGLSITCYNLSQTTTTPSIVIRNSRFVNNTAFPSQELIQSSSNLFTDFTFTGRGGAIILLLIDSNVTNIHVMVENCTFEYNVGEAFGGAVYTIFWPGTTHNATFYNCTFRRNRSGDAGGLLGAFFGAGTEERFSFMNISHCWFVENEADQGGGSDFLLPDLPVDADRWNYARYEYCTFERNNATDFAAGLAFGSPRVIRDRSNDRAFEIHSCTFTNNSHKASTTFGSVFVPVVFEGTTVFSGSEGSAIQLVGSLISLKGRLNISGGDTTASNNGAMHFTTYSQLQLFKGAEIHFSDNIGGIGASITTEYMENHQAFNHLLYNPLCFLLYENLQVPPDNWTNVSIHFSHNEALAGAVGFFPSLDVCSWIQFKDPFFNKERVLNWSFIDLGINTNSFHKNDPSNQIWYTQTETHSLIVEDHTLELFPGEDINQRFTAYDQLGQPVASFIRLVSQTDVDDQDINFNFDPSLDLYSEINQTIDAKTLAESHLVNSSIGTLPLQTVLVQNFLQQTNAKDFFVLHSKNCPVGYTLEPIPMDYNHSVCTCNKYNSDILACSGTRLSFMKDIWATSTSESIDRLYVHHCPTGYCQCQLSSDTGLDTCLYFYDENVPDEQCSCLRSGILCGECINGTGVSAVLNNCVECNNLHGFLIPLLFVTDVVVLVVIMLLLTTPIPDWLYPCFMFLQLLPFTTESIKLGFEISRPVLLYLACGLSFYFPYDACLYSGTSALAVYALRFIPVLADVIVFPVTLLLMWRFLKRHFLLPWHSLWIIILLQYMHVMYSAMSILHCTRIPIDYNTTELRWYVDGEITCFTGAHLALSMLAMIILVIFTSLIALTVVLTSGRFRDVKYLSMLREPLLLAGFKYKWWFSAELFQRVLFIVVAVCSPGSVYPLLLTACIVSTVVLYIQPYASKLANFLEAIFLVNAIIFFTVAIPESFQTLELFNVTDDGPCNVNGTSIYIFAYFVYFITVSYYVPFITTILVVTVSIARIIRRHAMRKLRNASRKSAMSYQRSLRERVYSGLVSRAGVTKTSVLVRFFSSSATIKRKQEDIGESQGMELIDGIQHFSVASGDTPYKEIC